MYKVGNTKIGESYIIFGILYELKPLIPRLLPDCIEFYPLLHIDINESPKILNEWKRKT